MNNQMFRRTVVTGVLLAVVMLLQAALPEQAFAGENVPVKTDISVTYIVNGNAESAGGDVFTLTADEPGTPMPGGKAGGSKSITIGKEGTYSFGEICYDRPDVYWYTITRDATEKKGVKKDDSVYRAKVIALNDGHGYVLVYKKGNKEKEELVYTDQTAPETGDGNRLLIYSAMALAAAAVLAVLATVRRNNERKGDAE